MTAADDLIRRQDAINAIRSEMKRTYTAARRQGYKQSMQLLEELPSAQTKTITLAEPIALSPAPLHSYWFYNAGWFFCDNCGGRGCASGYTPYCQHCGARMDAEPEDDGNG